MIKIKKIICALIAAFILILPVTAVPVDEEVTPPSWTSPPSRVIITGFTVRGGGLVAGEVSTVVFTLRNTGRWVGVSSVIMTGSIESAAPVEFVGTNQVFIGRIPPDSETTVEIEYYTRNVDLTALRSISASFLIGYEDESIGIERFNSVSVRLPVLRGARTTIDEENMRWAVPHTSRRDALLYSGAMQAVYTGGFILCAIWIIIILLFKLGILRRKV